MQSFFINCSTLKDTSWCIIACKSMFQLIQICIHTTLILTLSGWLACSAYDMGHSLKRKSINIEKRNMWDTRNNYFLEWPSPQKVFSITLKATMILLELLLNSYSKVLFQYYWCHSTKYTSTPCWDPDVQ